MKSIMTLAVAVLLTACGGGGGSSTPSTATASAAPAPICKPVRIQLFGDSTQWGMDAAAKGAWTRVASYPELVLQQEMDRQFGAGKVVVSTRAVPGTDTTMLLAGTDGLNKPWPQSVDADIVVINHGINDKLTWEQYKANLRLLTKAPATVVLETPLPLAWGDAAMSDSVRAVAAETGVPLIDSHKYALSMSNWFQYTSDGMHPTNEGYALVARNAKFPALAPIVSKIGCGK